MSISASAIASRTMSAYPVSIGTSLALESLGDGPNPPYDPEREIPDRIDLTYYDEVWLNLHCLFRNIMGSLDPVGANSVLPGDLADTLEFEVDLIRKLVNESTYGKTNTIVYASDYAGLERKYPHARLRKGTTDKQRIYTALLVNTLNVYLKGQVKSNSLLHFHLEIKPKKTSKALILTNYAIDLLNHHRFKELNLLESHTGVLKSLSAFNTKYTGGKDLIRIPFNAAMLQVFGDSTTFHQWPKATRLEVLELADKYEWNALTTNDRLKYSISNMSDGYAAKLLLNMLH